MYNLEIVRVRSSAEYNWRAAIIEGLCAGRSPTEIIRFFEDPRSTMYDPDVIPVVARMKFPANVHILSITSGENDVMPPHLFKKGETITKEVYLRILRTKPRVNRGWKLFPGGHISFSRTAYTSHLVNYWEARIP